MTSARAAVGTAANFSRTRRDLAHAEQPVGAHVAEPRHAAVG